ncbi:MAG: helix-hairpin-helix domain-containing protein [bacterium]
MKIYVSLIISLLIFSPKILYSQQDSAAEQSDTTDFRKSFQEEILLEDLKSDEEDSKILDFLQNLKRNPYDLNKVTLSQLESIPFLNRVIAKKIIDYRNEIKVYRSKRALLKIEGISYDLYEKIKIYLVVRQSVKDIMIDETGRKISVHRLKTKQNIKARARFRVLQDLQPRDGFLTGKYLGSRPKIYNQFNSKYDKFNYKIEANLTLEKDAGEMNLTDFVSGFLELKDYDFIKNIVAGDYTLNFAQGLAMWSSQYFSKGINAVNPLKKRGKGIDGYSSVNEIQFFRGSAARLNFKNFNFDLFYSNNPYDAAIDTSLNEVTSFYYDGYHRTSSETKRQNSAIEKLFGGRITFENGSMRLGTTYWRSTFSKSIIPDSVKQLFNFSGTSANMIGVDYDFIYKNMNFYGEFARSQSNSIANINALQITFFKFADILFSYRNYPVDFAPLHSSGFGERNGETNNEIGFYSGITFRPVKGLIVNSYFDQFKLPYRTFFNPVPTSGTDFLTNMEWRAGKGFAVNLKYKNENKEIVRTIGDEFKRDVKRIDSRNQLNIRAGFIYRLTERFRLRSRFEYVKINYSNFGGNNGGYLFFSDLRIIPVIGLVFDTRFIFFDTDDYDSRIYEFESDILGVMSNIALYGKGRRWYLLLKYKFYSHIEIAAKYAETYIDGVKSIGSGNDKIKGDVNNRLSLGVEVGF